MQLPKVYAQRHYSNREIMSALQLKHILRHPKMPPFPPPPVRSFAVHPYCALFASPLALSAVAWQRVQLPFVCSYFSISTLPARKLLENKPIRKARLFSRFATVSVFFACSPKFTFCCSHEVRTHSPQRRQSSFLQARGEHRRDMRIPASI